MNPLLEAALELLRAGVSVIPVKADRSKAPAIQWKEYQSRLPTEAEVHEWFGRPGYGLGIVTGAVSGNLEMTEIEGRALPEMAKVRELVQAVGLAGVYEHATGGWFEMSPSNGIHWFYRVQGEPVPGNTKIARRPATPDELREAPKDKIKVLAETRGEGGYVVVAPTPGDFHPLRKPWVRVQGPEHVRVLSDDQRKEFHRILASMGTETAPVVGTPAPAGVFSGRTPDTGGVFGGVTPGDDYNEKTSWPDILQPAGWTHIYTAGGTSYWRRPGKTDYGISATTGHSTDGVERLYVFTTSTDFPDNEPITKFGAYSILHHGGDFSAAASELGRKGFGRAPVRAVPGPTQAAAAKHPPAGGEAGTAPYSGPPVSQGNLAVMADYRPQPAPAAAPVSSPQTTPAMSDDGNAMFLIEQFGAIVRYNADRARWLCWTGTRWEWQPKGGGLVREYAKEIGRQLPGGNTKERQHQKYSLGATGISNLLAVAQTDTRLTVSTEQLDAHPWELNTPGGIIDLRTGELLPADPAKLHTRQTKVVPDFGADRAFLMGFLRQTFPDPELLEYVQRLVGYSAIGEVHAHILPFGYGSGGNGKGVLFEMIMRVLGDYATSSPNGFLMASKFPQHSTEIARLAGARFVACAEVDQADRFDEAKIKLLCGGDTLTARFMRQDDFTFRPTHQLWLAGNFQPAVDSGGDGFWRRLRLIPFTNTVPDDRKIDGLSDILAGEHGPAVLAWIAEGASKFGNYGLQEPESVRAATKAYQLSVDTVGRFLEDACVIGGVAATMGGRVECSKLRNAYDDWCSENGERPVTKTFAAELAKHGVLVGAQAPRGTNGVRTYGNILLRSDLPPEPSDDGVTDKPFRAGY